MSKLRAASARQEAVAGRKAAVLSLGADSALVHSERNTLLRTVLAHVADTAAAAMTATSQCMGCMLANNVVSTNRGPGRQRGPVAVEQKDDDGLCFDQQLST
jgi:hypothetical protein